MVNRDRSPLKILGTEFTNQDFAAALRTLEEGQRYELLITLNPKDTDGQFVTLLTVLTNKEKLPKIPIAVVATIAARVQVWPEQLSFGQINLASMRQDPPRPAWLDQRISIHSQEPGFKVIKAETSLLFLHLELVEPPRENLPYHIRVTLVKEKLQRGPFSGTIIVQTNDQEFAAVKIPISGEVR